MTDRYNHYFDISEKKKKKYDLKTNPNKPGWNDELDAFRHAYMQADLSNKYGSKAAKFLGDIHENIYDKLFTIQPHKEKNMDLWNNNIGRQVSNEVDKQTKILKNLTSPQIRQDITAENIYNKIKEGKLITNPNDSRVYTEPTLFDKAMQGWDFLTYFKTTTESATGIFKNMAGNLQSAQRTATELNYSVNGQEARLNMMLDAINRKVIVPMVEKTAEIIANFKLGREVIGLNDHGKSMFLEIDDNIRNANYIYRYGDRKATFERKMKLKELFEVVKSFAQVPEVEERIDWMECFKFALEQYGIENSNNFLTEK